MSFFCSSFFSKLNSFKTISLICFGRQKTLLIALSFYFIYTLRKVLFLLASLNSSLFLLFFDKKRNQTRHNLDFVVIMMVLLLLLMMIMRIKLKLIVYVIKKHIDTPLLANKKCPFLRKLKKSTFCFFTKKLTSAIDTNGNKIT